MAVRANAKFVTDTGCAAGAAAAPLEAVIVGIPIGGMVIPGIAGLSPSGPDAVDPGAAASDWLLPG